MATRAAARSMRPAGSRRSPSGKPATTRATSSRICRRLTAAAPAAGRRAGVRLVAGGAGALPPPSACPGVSCSQPWRASASARNSRRPSRLMRRPWLSPWIDNSRLSLAISPWRSPNRSASIRRKPCRECLESDWLQRRTRLADRPNRDRAEHRQRQHARLQPSGAGDAFGRRADRHQHRRRCAGQQHPPAVQRFPEPAALARQHRQELLRHQPAVPDRAGRPDPQRRLQRQRRLGQLLRRAQRASSTPESIGLRQQSSARPGSWRSASTA